MSAPVPWMLIEALQARDMLIWRGLDRYMPCIIADESAWDTRLDLLGATIPIDGEYYRRVDRYPSSAEKMLLLTSGYQSALNPANETTRGRLQQAMREFQETILDVTIALRARGGAAALGTRGVLDTLLTYQQRGRAIFRVGCRAELWAVDAFTQAFAPREDARAGVAVDAARSWQGQRLDEMRARSRLARGALTAGARARLLAQLGDLPPDPDDGTVAISPAQAELFARLLEERAAATGGTGDGDLRLPRA